MGHKLCRAKKPRGFFFTYFFYRISANFHYIIKVQHTITTKFGILYSCVLCTHSCKFSIDTSRSKVLVCVLNLVLCCRCRGSVKYCLLNLVQNISKYSKFSGDILFYSCSILLNLLVVKHFTMYIVNNLL